MHERKAGKMSYTCPKCGMPMQCISTASIPPIIRYECFGCGYASKPVRETPYYAELPKELWQEGNDDEEDNN